MDTSQFSSKLLENMHGFWCVVYGVSYRAVITIDDVIIVITVFELLFGRRPFTLEWWHQGTLVLIRASVVPVTSRSRALDRQHDFDWWSLLTACCSCDALN